MASLLPSHQSFFKNPIIADMNMLDVLYQSPQKVITYTWLTSLVLLFVTFLVMCVAVSRKFW